MQKNNSIKMYQLLMLSHGIYLRGIRFLRQQSVPIPYKGIKLGTDLRLDLLVEDKVIVDLKAKDKLSSIDEFQISSFKFLTNIYKPFC
jgi:GxxExxY protein